MHILIRRGSHMDGPWGLPPQSKADKLLICVQDDATHIAEGFEIDFDRIKNLNPGEEIRG